MSKEPVYIAELAALVIRCAIVLESAHESYGFCRWSSKGGLGQCRVGVSDLVQRRITTLVIRGKVDEECRGPGARGSGKTCKEVAEVSWVVNLK